MIAVCDENIAAFVGQVVTQRQNGNLCREASGGSAVTLENHRFLQTIRSRERAHHLMATRIPGSIDQEEQRRCHNKAQTQKQPKGAGYHGRNACRRTGSSVGTDFAPEKLDEKMILSCGYSRQEQPGEMRWRGELGEAC